MKSFHRPFFNQLVMPNEIIPGEFCPRIRSPGWVCYRHANHGAGIQKPTLVGGWATILKNMSSSMGRMTSQHYGKKNHLWNHQPVQNWMILFVQMLVYVCINIPAPWWAVIWELRVLSWILQQFSWGRLTGNPGFCGNWFPFSKCSQKHPTLGFLGCK